ncbi:glycosyl hydrolase [Myxococcaceae bacterium GXIMD 01537]
MRTSTRWWLARLLLVWWGASAPALAQVEPQRTFHALPSSNGHGAVVLDLTSKRLTHFREHLYATEEPQLDAQGNEVFSGQPATPQAVPTRDLLYDAYFGLRSEGTQRWLTADAAQVDADASGYAAWGSGKTGGTGVATLVLRVGALELTQFVFAPQGLPHAGFVMALRVRNTGTAPANGVSVFSLHNFHLGYGRPGVNQDIGESGETVFLDGNLFVERAFAGVVTARPLGAVSRRAAWNEGSPNAQNAYFIVEGGGTKDLPDGVGSSTAATGWATAYQFDLGTVAAGAEKWAGVAFAHHGDPFAAPAVKTWLEEYVGTRDAQALVEAELAHWAGFQQAVKVPSGVAADEEDLVRHSAVVLRMAQVREREAYMRAFLTSDSDTRRTRLKRDDGSAATLPATLKHRGYGAVLASLPPGQWTYAWVRDGAYAAAAMATLGLKGEARDALSYYLDADSGRFQHWRELESYAMPPYLITLTRYHGFGVEETDFNDFGPNLEFDGFGLFLWALRHYERETGDATLVDERWSTVSTKVADALVALIDPATGLIRPDSSIWETHWNGRERAWAYTSITAARGLCDAAALAQRKGDTQRATRYRNAGEALRRAIAERLTDGSHAIASNTRELAAGRGYSDAAVLDAISMGLFDPAGPIARGTLARLDSTLTTVAGPGWARNDDSGDHFGKEDLSPWGSEYDSAEWVIVDLRGAIAQRLAGDTARADKLLQWVKAQSLKNYLAIAETYDEGTGAYKFNAPMVGFGAGAYALALAQRASGAVDPACGAYFDEGAVVTPGPDGGTPDGGGPDGGPARPDAGPGTGGPDAGSTGDEGDDIVDSGCSCGVGGAGVLAVWALVSLAGVARRRRGE